VYKVSRTAQTKKPGEVIFVGTPPDISIKKVSLSLWTLGSRAVCSIANGCIPVTPRGGKTRQCKNDSSAEDDYEIAHNVYRYARREF
jgi:hypothetical protein